MVRAGGDLVGVCTHLHVEKRSSRLWLSAIETLLSGCGQDSFRDALVNVRMLSAIS